MTRSGFGLRASGFGRNWLLVLGGVACGAKPATKPEHAKPAPLDTMVASACEAAGTWRWILETADNGTARVEDETWELAPVAGKPDALAGRYVRTVDVRSTDRIPFQCNQRAWYRQRAVYDVTARRGADGTFAITEAAYRTEATPCDHGFRHVGTYTGKLDGGKLVLAFGDGGGASAGTQTLLRIGDAAQTPAADPWPAKALLVGAWRWDASSVDEDGNVRDETEWWEIARATDTKLDATLPPPRRRAHARRHDHHRVRPTRRATASTTRTSSRARARTNTGTSSRPRRRPAITRACARRRAARSTRRSSSSSATTSCSSGAASGGRCCIDSNHGGKASGFRLQASGRRTGVLQSLPTPPVPGLLSRRSNLNLSGRVGRPDGQVVWDRIQSKDGAAAHRKERGERDAAVAGDRDQAGEPVPVAARGG